MNIYPLFAYFSLFSPILPIGIGASKILSLNRGMKILLFYIFFAFTMDVYLMWFVRGRQLQVGVVHLYYLIENIFVMLIIHIWQESRYMKMFFTALMLLYIIFWIIAKATFEPLSGLYSITASASQVSLTLAAGYTLFIAIENRVQSIINDFRFWVLLSFVIYFAGTVLIIALRGILLHYSIETLFLVSSIDWSLKILFNILFTIGFLCPQTRR